MRRLDLTYARLYGEVQNLNLAIRSLQDSPSDDTKIQKKHLIFAFYARRFLGLCIYHGL